MAAITTRQTGTTGVDGVTRKNAPLTNTEIDNNFISLNNGKLETSFTGNTNIVTLGTIATGTWNATTIATTRGGTGLTSFNSGGAVYATSTSALTTGTLPVASGGTGQTSFTNGQLLIGNTTGNTLSRATLTQNSADQVIITNGAGSITLSLPQSINTTSSVRFAAVGVGVAPSGTAGTGYINNSLGVGTAPSGTAGQIRASNSIIAFQTSDVKYKENIKDIPNALEVVLSIGGKLFDWKDDYIASNGGEDGYYVRKNDFGVIAQDVETAFPLAVRKKADGSLAVDYEKLCALAFAAIKELNNQIQEIKGIK
jgi:hypothetical protein